MAILLTASALLALTGGFTPSGMIAHSAPAPTPRAEDRSAGCGRPAEPGILERSAPDGKARARSYRLLVPGGYEAAVSHPLTFVFHGAGTSSKHSLAFGLQRAVGAERGLFVFPDGIEFQRFGVGWDDGAQSDDLAFFDAMLRDVEAAYCIDRARIYVAGFSWGGDFAMALACHRGAVIDAVAANSAGDEFKDKADYRTYEGLPCAAGRHPRVRFEHAAGEDREYKAPYFATASRFFQSLNACGTAGAARAARAADGAPDCVDFAGCASAYRECTFDPGIGHALPRTWAQDAWDFFTQR